MPNSRLYFGVSSADEVTASNVGSGTGIFLAKVGNDLEFKSLVAGSNVSFSVDGETITINASDSIGVEDATNIGSGTGLFSSRVGSDLQFKSIIAGTNVSITSDANSITISATDAIGVEGAINLGTGEGIFSSRVGSDLQFKSLIAGDFIQISSNATTLTISAPDVEAFSDSIAILQSDVNILNGLAMQFNKATWTSDITGIYNLGSTPKSKSMSIWLYGVGGSTILRERAFVGAPTSSYDYYISGTNVVFNDLGPYWGVGVDFYFQWTY
jgi:hypothetical protein